MSKQTSAARVAAHNQRLAESGGARATFRLSPEVNAALDALAERRGQTRTAVIAELVLSAARQEAEK